MEILKGFSFDLQRHAFAWTSDSVTINESELNASGAVYFRLSTKDTTQNVAGITMSSSSVTAPANDGGNYYLKVTGDGAGNYTTSLVTDAGADVVVGTISNFTVTNLYFNGNTTGKTLKFTTATNAVTTPTNTIASIGANQTFTYKGTGTATYTAGTSGATITFKDAGTDGTDLSTLTSGSVVLSSAAGTAYIAAGNEVITAAGGDFTVGSNGQVSDLSVLDSLTIGNDNALSASGFTYAVTTAQYLTVTPSGGAGVRYYLNSALSNTTITASHDVATIDDISNAFATRLAGLTVGAGATPVYGATTGTDVTYAYQKNATVTIAGYPDGTLGTQVGVLTPDGNGYYSYTAASANASQTLGNTGNLVKNIVGSGKDDVITSTGAIAITIDGGAGADRIGFTAVADSSVDGGAGDDTINITKAAVNGVFVGGGDGNDRITVDNTAGATSSWTVAGGAGKDNIDLSAIIGSNTNWLVDAGDGDDNVVTNAALTYSTITAGAGNDTILSLDDTNTVTGGEGADVFDLANAAAEANISDYTYGTDFVRLTNVTGTSADQFATDVVKLATGGALSTDGKMDFNAAIAGANGKATVTSSGGFYAVNLVDDQVTKNKVDVAWVGSDATNIDASGLSTRTLLVGSTNSEGDLLIGGSKGDTLFAGTSDSVYGGAGSDLMTIDGGNKYGVYVGLSSVNGTGTDTVQGFTAGFDIETADAVYLVDSSINDTTISHSGVANGDITIKSGKGTLILDNAATAANSTKLLVGDKKVYSIAKNQSVAISDSDDIADYFYGTESSGINLANYQDDITVDLSSSMFKNITNVTGGKGSTTLMGSAKADTLYGGAGSSSLFGGAGKDSMVSGAGKTEFFITTGAGKDSVQGFVTGTNEDTSDVVNIFNAGISGISRSANDIFTIKVSDADSIQVKQATAGVDQKIQWASGEAKGVAKIGYTSQANTFTYDSEVTNYLGGSKNDTVTFSGSDDLSLWLDKETAYASIETFDASNSTGSVLIAGTTGASETIKGGRGDSSLWGGAGNQKDVLVGNTAATNIFFYGLGNGSDSISGSSKDTVNMFDIQLSDLVSADIDTSNRRVIVTTTAGDKVTVSGGVQDFVVGGVTYTTKYGSKTDWSVKE